MHVQKYTGIFKDITKAEWLSMPLEQNLICYLFTKCLRHCTTYTEGQVHYYLIIQINACYGSSSYTHLVPKLADFLCPGTNFTRVALGEFLGTSKK